VDVPAEFLLDGVTGYLLQVASSPSWVTGLLWAHVSTSLVFVIGYGTHLVIGWRLASVSTETVADRDNGALPRPARIPL